MNNPQIVSNDDIERLRKLLPYALDAIEYWFDSCEIDVDTEKENTFFKDECKYFINKLKE